VSTTSRVLPCSPCESCRRLCHHIQGWGRTAFSIPCWFRGTGGTVRQPRRCTFAHALFCRVLVCGDETQKPFPLLVWNLQSRKLLYDLRIPHHDFITSLSAITYEGTVVVRHLVAPNKHSVLSGSYVCCVCHEIDEPNPNFIVVYDLQSGTLFKKWKTIL
jgi:hypothetical protein